MITTIVNKIRSLIAFILATISILISMLIIRFFLFLANRTNKNLYEYYCQMVRDKINDLPDEKFRAYCFDVANVL